MRQAVLLRGDAHDFSERRRKGDKSNIFKCGQFLIDSGRAQNRAYEFGAIGKTIDFRNARHK